MLLKMPTLAQVFSREYCEIFKNSFFIDHLRWLLDYISHLRRRKIQKKITYIESTFSTASVISLLLSYVGSFFWCNIKELLQITCNVCLLRSFSQESRNVYFLWKGFNIWRKYPTSDSCCYWKYSILKD